MIRRDYILRILEEFFETLSRIKALKKGQNWREASGVMDGEFQHLIGDGAQAVAQLSETELLARLIRGEPTQVVREKTLMLSALLKEAGDIAAGEGRLQEGRACYLKGLNLLLGALARDDVFECPAFVPRVEMFLEAVADSPLPMATCAMLMQHYERAGEYGKAEDLLYSMMETQPEALGLVDFGISFYERLRGKSDANLEEGNLPRPELDSALASLRRRRAAVSA